MGTLSRSMQTFLSCLLVACGESAMGRDGSQTTVDAAATDAPTRPVRWAKFALGGSIGCGITTDSDVYCWGANANPELWGGQRSVTVPRRIAGIHALEIAVTQSTACAILLDHTVSCWGENLRGELGRGTFGTLEMNRAAGPGPTGLTDIAMITGSNSFAFCALSRTGSVFCWGSNGGGQSGTISNTFCWDSVNCNTTPSRVALESRAIAINTQWLSTCAVLEDHSVRCWGAPWRMLGTGPDRPPGCADNNCITLAPQPTHVQNVSQLWGGLDHRCVVHQDGTVSCWGGGPTIPIDRMLHPESEHSPTPAPMPGRVAALFGDINYGCARLEDATTWCWRADPFSMPVENQPPRTAPQREPRMERFKFVTGGAGVSCGIDHEGVGWCWGVGPFPTPGVARGQWVTEPIRVSDPVD